MHEQMRVVIDVPAKTSRHQSLFEPRLQQLHIRSAFNSKPVFVFPCARTSSSSGYAYAWFTATKYCESEWREGVDRAACA